MASRSAASTLAVGARRCTASASTSCLGTTQTSHSFSTTPQLEKTTRARSNMYRWMNKFGHEFQDSNNRTGPGYLTPEPGQVFPANPFFKSESVLGESMRAEIVRRVTREKQPLKVVSAQLGVDVRRIAAVLRLKAIEAHWQRQGKPLARPYAKAVMSMLPVMEYQGTNARFEPIHEQHVHKLTMQQLFVPVAESREFTREDAAKAFHRNMLSPDKRSPHPELIKLQKLHNEGGDLTQGWANFVEETRAEEDALRAKETEKHAAEERKLSRVKTKRFEFRFKDVNIDVAGATGRGRGGIGIRYGVPFNDRRKGAVKIPTSVP